ncbi:YhgE/Pip domain-containing protein [Leuconostoc sp. UCMA20149]|uniref:YhgE/Pip domain-containing protein n=1 Tax=Leuconostoc sp. UCMA20149 TaxID=2583528 RepID=UPI0025B0BEA4|nr:YhgE/Pip domain-containing protein [Leuconostoc sp. UCMA20149]MDN2451827.1 YhgE/Pip domain-containing protein [Leuconostoc sp. UCMA20149]
MKFWKSAEWERISKLRGLKLLLVGIAVIPSIYAVIFLSSLWDAYGNVDNLPVAIVNKDRTSEINNKDENLGQDLTNKLIEKKALKFSTVSSKEASKGLKSGKYYMTLTIPEDFTKNAGTLLSSDPKTSQIIIAHNTGQSFIAEKMTASAATKIQATVNKSLQKVYNKTILSAITSSESGLKSGSDGASNLDQGLGKLADGGNNLSDGAKTLTTGASSLKNGLSQYTQGVSQANSGTNSLVSGTVSAANGSTALANGTGQLASNMSLLESGSRQIALGAQQLADQLQKIGNEISNQQKAKTSDLTKLENGLEDLSDSLSTLDKLEIPTISINQTQLEEDSANLTSSLGATGQDVKSLSELSQNTEFKNFLASNPDFAKQYAAIMDGLSNNVPKSIKAAEGIKGQLDNLDAVLPELNALQKKLSSFKVQAKAGSLAAEVAKSTIETLSDNLTTISQGLLNDAVPGAQKLANGAENLNAGQKRATAAVNQLNSGAGQLASGNSQLAVGASQLSSGLNQLNNNSATLNSGATQLQTGSHKISDGSSQLVSGLQSAQQGTQTLAQKLAEGSIKLSVINNKNRNVNALSQPVKSSHHNLSTVQNNGTGMTPYMMSVGLFVGMITFSAIYDFVTVAKRPRNGFAWWAQKQAVNVPVWIAQALLLTTLLLLVDGLEPKNIPLLYLSALIVAFAFNQFVLLFSTLFGKLGSGLMIIALVLQLSASAGSYPIELSNGFFQAIHPWIPMTFSVHAFREAISIGGNITGDLIVLLSIGIISMVLTWGVYHWKLKHNNLIWSQD